jgi:hypothetical protein
VSESSKPKKNNELSEAAKTLGHAGGVRGGPARSKALTAEEREAIARQGGLAKAAKKKAVTRKLKGKKKPS